MLIEFISSPKYKGRKIDKTLNKVIEQPNLKILTPCYGGNVTAGYFHSVLNLFPYAVDNGIPFTVETMPNCSLISLGRDIMLRRAMNDKSWTHVMWIDADLQFQPQCIHSLILDDKDIVGGFYPKKVLPIDFASSPEPDGEDTEFLFETVFVATGFMLVKRHVIETMFDHYREELQFTYQGSSDFVDLFAPIIDPEKDNLYLTEDYAFCYRARELGFRCFMSKRFELPHTGPFTFSAEREEEMLKEYERMGKVSLQSDTKG